MAVADEKIIQKMIHELHQAKDNQHARKKMVDHIANVRLLCDLFLEEDEDRPSVNKTSENDFTEEEIKAMIGNQAGSNTVQSKQPSFAEHEEANGKSIFDF